MTAGELTGLNVQLFDETSAAALSYGFHLFNESQKEENNNNVYPKTVFFVDCGESALQVFACTFYEDHFKV